MHQRATWAALAIFITAACGVSASWGQTFWTDQSSRQGITVEFVKPEFAGKSDTDFLTSVTYLSGRFPIGQNVVAEIELPFARLAVSSEYEDFSKTGVGNPYVGARIQGDKVVSRVGVRIPTASWEDGAALAVGFVADFDRFEAFLPDVVTFVGSIARLAPLSDRVKLTVGGGPVLNILTVDAVENQAELFAQYHLIVTFEGSQVMVRGGITGRALVTETDLGLGERSIHQFGLGASLNTGTVRPGVHVRLPLDNDLGDSINFVAGVNLTVALD